MNNKNKNMEIAKDTINYFKNKEFDTKSYAITVELDKNIKHSENTTFKILDESCIRTVIGLEKSKEKIGLMNFASAKNMGGGFLKGSNAQEESIARVSNLSLEQEKLFTDFYAINRKIIISVCIVIMFYILKMLKLLKMIRVST